MSIHTDSVHVADEQEGLFLMLYHLRMAALYFETSPAKIDLADAIRGPEFSRSAIEAWLPAMEALYPED